MEIVEEWSKLANHVCPDKVNLEFIQPKLNFLLSKHIRSRSSIVVGVSSQQCSAIVSYNTHPTSTANILLINDNSAVGFLGDSTNIPHLLPYYRQFVDNGYYSSHVFNDGCLIMNQNKKCTDDVVHYLNVHYNEEQFRKELLIIQHDKLGCRLFQICKGVFTETKFKAVGYNKDVAHAYLMARKHDISISTPNDLISYGIKAILGALNDHTSVDARRFSIVCTVNDVPCKFCDPEQVKLFVCRIMEEQTKSTT